MELLFTANLLTSTEKLNQTQQKHTCIHNKIYYNTKRLNTGLAGLLPFNAVFNVDRLLMISFFVCLSCSFCFVVHYKSPYDDDDDDDDNADLQP